MPVTVFAGCATASSALLSLVQMRAEAEIAGLIVSVVPLPTVISPTTLAPALAPGGSTAAATVFLSEASTPADQFGRVDGLLPIFSSVSPAPVQLDCTTTRLGCAQIRVLGMPR